MMARGGTVDRARREAARRQAIDEAKANHNITDVMRRHAKVVRAGREFKSLCPFHREKTPSFQLNDAKGSYYCFGCAATGDIVDLVQHLQGVGFTDALRWLGAADLPAVDQAARLQAAAEDEAERAAATDRARLVWERAIPARGTPAEVYARSRSITMPLPPTIRFGQTPAWYDDETGECGPDLPALIGGVTDAAGDIIGVQRIFLADGGRAKARMAKPKRSLGRIKGGALKLHALLPPDQSELILTEGPEDGLSLAQGLPENEVWVTLGTAMMAEVKYPVGVRTLTIAGQNDGPGRDAVAKASAALVGRGFIVREMWPAPGFKDWNDQLRGVRS